MKIRRVLRIWLFLIVPVLGISLMLSCSSDKGTEIDDPDCPHRTTPDNLLKMFANAYMEMDLNDYDEYLDEIFLFGFTADVADSLGLPPEEPWWGKTDDVNSTREMFEDPDVLEIGFAYNYENDWELCQVVRPDSAYSGFCCRIEPLIWVKVSLLSEDDPILYYRVDNSWLDIMVVPDRFTQDLWCILSIDEVKKIRFVPEGMVRSATESSTWGGIKSMWVE